MIYGSSIGGANAIVVTNVAFAVLVSGSVYTTQKYEVWNIFRLIIHDEFDLYQFFFGFYSQQLSSSVRTALATGLALAVSIDVILSSSLIGKISSSLTRDLQMQWKYDRMIGI